MRRCITWEEAESIFPGCSAEWDRDIASSHDLINEEYSLLLESEDGRPWPFIRALERMCGSTACMCAYYNNFKNTWHLYAREMPSSQLSGHE